jgi:NAD(P) transhydrogenase
MNRYDLLVIGSGPAGQRAAIQAGKLGKKVAIIERRTMLGGVSVHTGTIPSKTLRVAALYLSGWDQRGLYGHSYRLKQDLTVDDLMQRVNITLQHEMDVIRNQLSRNGVVLIEGTASFKNDHELTVEDHDGRCEDFYGEKILIAVGSRPIRPEGIDFDNERIIDSDGILNLKKLPHHMVVVGAGVIGGEYASIFSTMDIKVTLLDGRDNMMGFMDRELIDELIHSLRKRGVNVRLGETVSSVNKIDNDRVELILESGKHIRADLALFAAGRIGCTYKLGLDKAGVEMDDRRRIDVNENFQTNVPHIYAAGDVIGFPALASTSMEQGRLAASHAFNGKKAVAAENFPFGIYAVPEMSMVGMTEQQLTEKQIPYEVGVARLRETARGQIMGLEEGILKMLFSLDDHRLLGVHILGEDATEMIHIGQAVLVLNGTLDFFLDNVFNYPTFAEAYKMAALDAWNRLNA